MSGKEGAACDSSIAPKELGDVWADPPSDLLGDKEKERETDLKHLLDDKQMARRHDRGTAESPTGVDEIVDDALNEDKHCLDVNDWTLSPGMLRDTCIGNDGFHEAKNTLVSDTYMPFPSSSLVLSPRSMYSRDAPATENVPVEGFAALGCQERVGDKRKRDCSSSTSANGDPFLLALEHYGTEDSNHSLVSLGSMTGCHPSQAYLEPPVMQQTDNESSEADSQAQFHHQANNESSAGVDKPSTNEPTAMDLVEKQAAHGSKVNNEDIQASEGWNLSPSSEMVAAVIGTKSGSQDAKRLPESRPERLEDDSPVDKLPFYPDDAHVNMEGCLEASNLGVDMGNSNGSFGDAFQSDSRATPPVNTALPFQPFKTAGCLPSSIAQASQQIPEAPAPPPRAEQQPMLPVASPPLRLPEPRAQRPLPHPPLHQPEDVLAPDVTPLPLLEDVKDAASDIGYCRILASDQGLSTYGNQYTKRDSKGKPRVMCIVEDCSSYAHWIRGCKGTCSFFCKSDYKIVMLPLDKEQG